ncbi:MAG: mechanosensitive ion channel [Candidatus Lokiarchaeota archaeon]|nr:mechanosensitive ion channel [Candidatus Lokiarchaeota archaeon]
MLKIQLNRLEESDKIKPKLSDSLKTFFKWILICIIAALVLGQFGVTTDWLASFFSLFGGTILGFAAINTIGNAIAGLIVRRTKPVNRGDRVLIEGEFADVLSINAIYTKLINMDNVIISIPNQKLIKREIRNYGRSRVVREKISVKLGYEHDFDFIEELLVDSVKTIPLVLKHPSPFVRIVSFGDYAAEYKLYVFIKQVKQINVLQGELHKKIFKACKKEGISLMTPLVHQKYIEKPVENISKPKKEAENDSKN